MLKKKLTIPEQIQDMTEKGITFNYNEEKDVIDFLKYKNYYFKLKSYGKNYDKYLATEKKGKYKSRLCLSTRTVYSWYAFT